MIRRSSLLAAVIALLIQNLVWGLLMPGAAAAAPPGAIAICTSDGLVYQAADGTLLTADGATVAPAKAGGHCPLCPLIAGLSLPPPAVTAAPPSARRAPAPALPEQQGAPRWFLATPQARAPPAV